MAGARIAGIRAGGTWGSSLTCGEFAAVRSAGFEPVGQVFGAAVYAAGAASGPSCPAAGGSVGGGMPGRSGRARARDGPVFFGPLVQAMYQARHTAIGRMTAECAQLGGHGVVGVRVSRGSFPLGGLEFTAIGTAVRAPGAGCGAAGAVHLGPVRAGFRQADHGGLGSRGARARHLDRVLAR